MKYIKAIACVLLATPLSPVFAYSQESSDTEEGPELLLTVNPLPMLFGMYTGHVEKKVSDSLSVWGEPTYFNPKAGVTGVIIDSAASADEALISVKSAWDSLSAWAIGGSIGVNYFPMKSSLADGYISPAISYQYLVISLGSFDTELGSTPPIELTGSQIGADIGAGYRWIWDWFGLGVEARVGFAYSSYSITMIYEFLDFFEISTSEALPSQITPTFSAGLKMYIAL